MPNKTIKLLIEHNANAHLKNNDGITVFNLLHNQRKNLSKETQLCTADCNFHEKISVVKEKLEKERAIKKTMKLLSQ